VNEEQRRQLAEFEEAVRKYISCLREEEIGLISWWMATQDLCERMNAAKAKIDVWHKHVTKEAA
jgi:hypothetical protein